MPAKKPTTRKATVAKKPVAKSTAPKTVKKSNDDDINDMIKKSGGAKAVKAQMEKKKATKTVTVRGGFLGLQKLGTQTYDSRYINKDGSFTKLGKQIVSKNKKKK